MSDPLLDLHAAMDEALQEAVPLSLKEKGWRYKDVYRLFRPAEWAIFLNELGDGEYKIICYSTSTRGVRGQFVMSPKAIERLEEFERRKAAETAK